MNQALKEFKQLFGSFHLNLKKMFLVQDIDVRKDDEKKQREKRFANAFFGCLFGFVAIITAIYYAPDLRDMAFSFILILFVYIAFCTIMSSLQVKKNNSGRKPKKNIGSFPELFYDTSDFEIVDNYIKTHYSEKNPMTTSECLVILTVIIKEGKVRDKSLDPMVSLFLKYYPKITPSVTNRAITKAKFYKAQQSKIEEMFQNCSKK